MEKNLDNFLIQFNENNLLSKNYLNAIKLAFIGDAIFDFYTRDYILNKFSGNIKMNELHKKNVSLVCAKSQARIIENLLNDNILTNDEIECYKNGRNSHNNSKSKNSNIIDYRKATGFEALIGSLYLNKEFDRLTFILKKASENFFI